MRSFGVQAGAAGRGLLALSAPLVAIGGLSLKAFTDFESSFAGVRKTVDATEEQFAELSAGFRQMALQIPVNVNELNRIGEAAGQLGIKTENILLFSRTMADLGVTTNLSSDMAATALARLANITGLPQEQVDRLGATIVELGNNLATTEAEIVDFGLRIAGAGTIAGLTEAQILAIGGAMSSVGVQAEAGGTAVQKVLLSMTEQVATAGEQLEVFAATAGMTSEQFSAAFREDAAGAFTAFVEGLGRAGTDAFAILEELGLQDQRLMRSFLSLAGAGDLLRSSIELGTTAFAENTALTAEAEKRYATAASQFTLLKNSLQEVAITIGETLVPMLLNLVQNLRPIVENIGEWVERNPVLTKVVLALAAAAATLGTALVGISLVLPGIVALAPAVGAAFGFMLGPIGLLTAAIAALALIFIPKVLSMRDTTDELTKSLAGARTATADWAFSLEGLATQLSVTEQAALDANSQFRQMLFDAERDTRGLLDQLEYAARETTSTIPQALQEAMAQAQEWMRKDVEATGAVITEEVQQWTEVYRESGDNLALIVRQQLEELDQLAEEQLAKTLADMNRTVNIAIAAREGMIDPEKFIQASEELFKAMEGQLLSFEDVVRDVRKAAEDEARSILETAERLAQSIQEQEAAFAALRRFGEAAPTGQNLALAIAEQMGKALGRGVLTIEAIPELQRRAQVLGLPSIGPQTRLAPDVLKAILAQTFAPEFWQEHGFLTLPGVERLQHGGLVRQPTLALLGERGPEAVMPLRGNGQGVASLVINTTVNGPVFGMQDLEDKVAQIWRDVARAGGFVGVLP